ncbi:MAG: HU family DNA-binding protein [Deltaproteobacteria bacterium]|jgi:nucleoid DNA-binding protein|nr:HU family DNA-binding protein [Deltaproteobacteria bacterium]
MENKAFPTFTRSLIILNLQERLSLSKREAGKLLESVLDILTQSLAESDPVTILGLGTFYVKSQNARPGRNPKTGNFAPIPERLKPSFTVDPNLMGQMLKNYEKGLF